MADVKITISELERCLKNNLSAQEIAKMYGCNKKTIWKKIRKLKKQRELNIVEEEPKEYTPRYFDVNIDDVMYINGMSQTVISIGDEFFTTIRANAVRESYLIKDFIYSLSSFLINKKKIESECGNCIHNKYGKCDLHKQHFYEIYKNNQLCGNKQPINEDDIYGEDTFITYM